ncbi:MAG: HD domain-containing protein [Lachnospiraceae bacterium]|nr:HD domain-containing protein [Lachnospiraceae bacterium]
MRYITLNRDKAGSLNGFNEHMRVLAKDENIKRMREYFSHGTISTYKHCLRVAKKSYEIAEKTGIRLSTKEMLRGAMLHDYFLYDWHFKGDKLHGYNHPHIALKNAAEDFDLTEIEKNIIESHMWPLTLLSIPKCREAVIVCIADKLCSMEETFRMREPGQRLLSSETIKEYIRRITVKK